MKPFRFKNFTIIQQKEVFNVGTDGVLLGALANCDGAEKILEVGTGTGLISMMLAQRNLKAEISALDIDENAAKLASENFGNSPYADRLHVQNIDFNFFETVQKFDLIACNPPYFDISESEKHKTARQKIDLDFQQVVKNSAKHLAANGIFSVIIPAESAEEFMQISSENGLKLIRKVSVYGIVDSKVKRVVLEFSFEEKPTIFEDFVIEKSPRLYSDQYLELTKEFHVFGK